MNHNKVLKDILTEWNNLVYGIDTDAAHSIDLTNSYHFVLLERAMNGINLPSWFDKKSLMKEIRVDEKFFADLVEEKDKKKKLTKDQLRDKLAAADPGLEAQGTVKTKVYGDLTDTQFIKVIKSEFNVKTVTKLDPKTGQNNSSSPLFIWKDGDFDYEINLTKTSVTGRGAKQTTDQELSWLLVLSGMQYGGDPKNKDKFISLMISNSQVYDIIDGMSQSTAFGLAAFLENNESWYDSHVKQGKAFMAKISNKQPVKYVKDKSTLTVNTEAKRLYGLENHTSKFDIDKWNPADVWLEYNPVPTNFKSLAELNNWLLKSLDDGNGYVGVSLKKGKGSVGIVNGEKKKVYKLTSLDLKYGYLFSQGVEFKYHGENLDGLGLAFRIFQGKATETIRGEGTSTGADAVQGKVAMHAIKAFKGGSAIKGKVEAIKGTHITLAQDPNSKNKKDKLWDWTSKGKSKFKLAQKAYKGLKGASFDDTATHGKWSEAFGSSDKFLKVLNAWAPPPPDKTNKQENSIIANISARFQSLVFGYEINKASNQEELMVGMLKYGKSESDWSSAHYKAQ